MRNSGSSTVQILTIVLGPRSILDRLSKVAPADHRKFIESSQEIEGAYIKAAEKGHTEATPAEDEVEHHYICFVNVANHLHALDRDLEGPLQIGQLADGEDVLHAVGLDVIKKLIESKKKDSFGMLALVVDNQLETARELEYPEIFDRSLR